MKNTSIRIVAGFIALATVIGAGLGLAVTNFSATELQASVAWGDQAHGRGDEVVYNGRTYICINKSECSKYEPGVANIWTWKLKNDQAYDYLSSEKGYNNGISYNNNTPSTVKSADGGIYQCTNKNCTNRSLNTSWAWKKTGQTDPGNGGGGTIDLSDIDNNSVTTNNLVVDENATIAGDLNVGDELSANKINGHEIYAARDNSDPSNKPGLVSGYELEVREGGIHGINTVGDTEIPIQMKSPTKFDKDVIISGNVDIVGLILGTNTFTDKTTFNEGFDVASGSGNFIQGLITPSIKNFTNNGSPIYIEDNTSISGYLHVEGPVKASSISPISSDQNLTLNGIVDFVGGTGNFTEGLITSVINNFSSSESILINDSARVAGDLTVEGQLNATLGDIQAEQNQWGTITNATFENGNIKCATQGQYLISVNVNSQSGECASL